MARILIVDDDHDVATTLQDILVEEGFHCRVAHSCHQAITALSDFQPTIVLTDLLLRGEESTELIEHIQRNCPPNDPIIILMTASPKRAETIQYKIGVLSKPFAIERLIEVLGGYIEN